MTDGALRDVRDPYLPPDPTAFGAARASGRVIVIAPTRAACETIELAFTLDLPTVLWQQAGPRMLELARARRPFGIVAGTGTGKTLAVRPIAQAWLGTEELRVGVINREREATPESPTWNVVIVTTGIARRWFQDGDIRPQDLLVVDEIHQTSAELELCLALGKRVGCPFIWLSATVDPSFYAEYLRAEAVVESSAFDPAKAADVRVMNESPVHFLGDRFLQQVTKERRGVGVFLPTRAGVEEIAAVVQARFPRMNVAYYHGGEPIRVIRPFLEGQEAKPFLLAMTAAGQSALNVQGLDTVIIHDTRFANLVERGRNVLTRVHLGANEILQMAGRVHGRVAGGRVFILSDRDIQFHRLVATPPDFQLAGDSERVALTCADLGVRADDLELPVPLDKRAYREALAFLEARGVVEQGRLTRYGRSVEAMPVDRPWAELLVHCDDALLPYVAVMAGIESLHRMTREERDLTGCIVPGSDHLTAYNLYAEAFGRCGSVGEVYGLPRHLFGEQVVQWGEKRGVLVKALEDAALAMASVYRAVRLPLPERMPRTTPAIERAWIDLVARIQPFDLVIEEQTAEGDEARVSKTSVCGSWGAVAGALRYFADRFGIPRAGIEGTQLPMDAVRRHATVHPATLVYDARHRDAPLADERRVTYHGFELSREREPLRDFPPGREAEARRLLAAALARGEARHPAIPRNQRAIEEVRECWRRSGGTIARLGQEELAAWYERELADVTTLAGFRSAPLRFDAEAWVPAAARARWMALPGLAEVRGKHAALHYEVEETPEGARGVVRLVLPEKLARGLHESELPDVDRPLRFSVTRGARGAVKADTLEELDEKLSAPWTDDELAWDRARDRGRPGERQGRGGRDARGEPRGGGRGGRDDRGRDDRRGPGDRGFRGPGGQRGGDLRDKGGHRPGSPGGRGKRRGKGR